MTPEIASTRATTSPLGLPALVHLYLIAKMYLVPTRAGFGVFRFSFCSLINISFRGFRLVRLRALAFATKDLA